MFFDDKKNKNKINLGDKKIESKEEFMKKLRDEKSNQLKKAEQLEKNNKIKSFLIFLNKKKCSNSIYQITLKNLRSVRALLEHKKDLEKNLVEKIFENTFNKIQTDLNKIFSSNLKNVEELIIVFLSIFSQISFDKKILLIANNISLFLNIFTSSIIYFQNLLKKGNLIDGEISFFFLLDFFDTLKESEIFEHIFKLLSIREYLFYFLNNILKNSKKLIEKKFKRKMLNFLVEINRHIIFSQKKDYQIFYESSLKFIVEYKDLYDKENNILLIILSKITNEISLKFFVENDFIFMLDNINREIKDSKRKNFFIREMPSRNNLINLFNMFFLCFRKIDMKIINNKNSKENVIKNIYNILELIFEFYGNTKKISLSIEEEKNLTNNNISNIPNNSSIFNNNNKNNNLIDLNMNNNNNSFNNFFNNKKKDLEPLYKKLIDVQKTEKLILLIFQCIKIIKKMHDLQYENIDIMGFFDNIINKIGKNFKEISENILLFSLKFLDFKFEQKTIHSFNIREINKYFQVIAFCLYSKIEFRENIFFMEFKNTSDIYENIPFNFIYLNNITRMLIHIFSFLINKKDIEYFETLLNNPIIHSLKSLYNLDSEIQFSQSKDNFWANMELISRIKKFSQKKLIKAMKIMPFIFPFVYRLTFLNDHLKSIKQAAFNNINIQRPRSFFDDDYDEPQENMYVSRFTVSRKNIFDEAFSLYLKGKLMPFAKWEVTFVNEFGMKEEGSMVIFCFFILDKFFS